MRFRHNRFTSIRALAEPIERLAQANIALILTQAIIIRLSIELADAAEPDSLVLVAFLAACVVAGVLVFFLNRIVRRFPKRGTRIAIAIGSLILQATAFQLLHGYAS